MTRNCYNFLKKRADALDVAANAVPTEQDLLRLSDTLVGPDGVLDPKDFLKLKAAKNAIVRGAKHIGRKVVHGVTKPVDKALEASAEFSKTIPGSQARADFLVPNKPIRVNADKGTNTDISWGVANGVIPQAFINNKQIIRDRADVMPRLALLSKAVREGSISLSKAKELAGQYVLGSNQRYNDRMQIAADIDAYNNRPGNMSDDTYEQIEAAEGAERTKQAYNNFINRLKSEQSKQQEITEQQGLADVRKRLSDAAEAYRNSSYLPKPSLWGAINAYEDSMRNEPPKDDDWIKEETNRLQNAEENNPRHVAPEMADTGSSPDNPTIQNSGNPQHTESEGVEHYEPSGPADPEFVAFVRSQEQAERNKQAYLNRLKMAGFIGGGALGGGLLGAGIAGEGNRLLGGTLGAVGGGSLGYLAHRLAKEHGYV